MENSSVEQDAFIDTDTTSLLENELHEGYDVGSSEHHDYIDIYALPVATFKLESWWNVFEERYQRHSLKWTIILIAAYMLIFVIGVIGNSMVILVVLLRPTMRTVTNMFIMNLAVADLFVILFCVPVTLLSNIFKPWILGPILCKSASYVQGVAVCASAYSLAAISLDRCKAIYRPMERSGGLSKKQSIISTILIWTIGILLTIPWAITFQVINSEKDGLPYCVETWENKTHGKIYFLVVNFLCFYALPLILIFISNVIIWRNVSDRQVPLDSASEGSIKRMHQRTRHDVLKMLGVVTLTFLFSWLPLYIIVMRLKFTTNTDQSDYNMLIIMMPFAQWLGSWNSCINPLLYAFMNSKFREKFKSILPNWMMFCFHSNGNNLRMVRSTSQVRINRANVSDTGIAGTLRFGTNEPPTQQQPLQESYLLVNNGQGNVHAPMARLSMAIALEPPRVKTVTFVTFVAGGGENDNNETIETTV